MEPDIKASFLDGRVVVLIDDITRQGVDAIVNAANSTLLGGGGVDGAIHRIGGPQILQECRVIRETKYPQGLPTGQAVITTGGELPARFVIHTVGPIYGRDKEREASLLAAVLPEFASISTGTPARFYRFSFYFNGRIWLSA